MEAYRSEWDCEWDLVTNDFLVIRKSYEMTSKTYESDICQNDSLDFYESDREHLLHCFDRIKQGKGIDDHFTFVQYFLSRYPLKYNIKSIEKSTALFQVKKSTKLLNKLKSSDMSDIDLKTYAKILEIRTDLVNKHELNLFNHV